MRRLANLIVFVTITLVGLAGLYHLQFPVYRAILALAGE